MSEEEGYEPADSPFMKEGTDTAYPTKPEDLCDECKPLGFCKKGNPERFEAYQIKSIGTITLMLIASVIFSSCSNNSGCPGRIEYRSVDIKRDPNNFADIANENDLKRVYIISKSLHDKIQFTIKETHRIFNYDTLKREKIDGKPEVSYQDNFMTLEPGEEREIDLNITVMSRGGHDHYEYEEVEYEIVGCRDLTEEMESRNKSE